MRFRFEPKVSKNHLLSTLACSRLSDDVTGHVDFYILLGRFTTVNKAREQQANHLTGLLSFHQDRRAFEQWQYKRA